MKAAKRMKRKRTSPDKSITVSASVAEAIADARRRDALEKRVERRKEKAVAAVTVVPEVKVVAVD